MAACNTGLNSPQGRQHVPRLWFWLWCHFMLLPLSSNKAWAFNFISCKIPDKPSDSRPGQKYVFCNFFRWVTKMRIMMPWGTWKVLSKLGYSIFLSVMVQDMSWAGKELICSKWAIFYFHIMFMHKEVWGKLVTFDLFSAWDWGVPGNVLAEHMGFIKTSCRVSWLFTFLSFRSLTPLIRLNIWNINLFWVSLLRSIVTQDTVLQLAEVQHQSSCYLQFWFWQLFSDMSFSAWNCNIPLLVLLTEHFSRFIP